MLPRLPSIETAFKLIKLKQNYYESKNQTFSALFVFQYF